jgi:uncharacterized protein YjbI with pentapeptide repeats
MSSIAIAFDENHLKDLLRLNQCEECDLSGAALIGKDLRGANLKGANLRGADIRESILRGADLSGANMTGVDLRETTLRGANLRNADLSEADLRGADLAETDLTGADMTGANLKGTNLKRAKLGDASSSPKSKKSAPRAENISEWLKSIGLEIYEAEFLKSEVTIDILSELTDSDLKEMGVKTVGARKRILKAAKEL